MIKKLLVYMLVFVFTASVVYAVPGSWYGYVTHDAATAADGVVIDAYISSSVAGTTTVGTVQSNGYYLIHVAGNVGDNVWFKVYGNNVTQAAQVWAAGFNHPQFNLTATSTANTQTCPTYTGYTAGTNVANLGCAGGFCVHDICRAASTFCGDGHCDTGETCTADCGGGGSSSTSGGGSSSASCSESWICEAWSECAISEIQTRTCTDSNSCGTTTSKPAESQSCIYAPSAPEEVSLGTASEEIVNAIPVAPPPPPEAPEEPSAAKTELITPLNFGFLTIALMAIALIAIILDLKRKRL